MPTRAPLQLFLWSDIPMTWMFSLTRRRSCAHSRVGGNAGIIWRPEKTSGSRSKVFADTPGFGAIATVDGFCHTVTVVLVDGALLDKGGDSLWNWLSDCWNHTRASNGRHAMLAVALDERVSRRFIAKRPDYTSLQLLQVHNLGEPAIRPGNVLSVSPACMQGSAGTSASPFLGFDAGHLKLFISHAKMDGLPLARA